MAYSKISSIYMRMRLAVSCFSSQIGAKICCMSAFVMSPKGLSPLTPYACVDNRFFHVCALFSGFFQPGTLISLINSSATSKNVFLALTTLRALAFFACCSFCNCSAGTPSPAAMLAMRSCAFSRAWLRVILLVLPSDLSTTLPST